MKIIKEDNSKNMKYALKDFENAYRKLVYEWSRNPSLKGDEDYPFNKSFDELNIPLWVESFLKEIRKF